MKTLSKTLVALFAAAAAFGVAAQESKVDLKNAKQQQAGGLANSQSANIGNATGQGAKSNVNATNLTQQQAGGLANSQKIDIGNASKGATSNVTASNITQQQAGGLANSQTMNAGNTK